MSEYGWGKRLFETGLVAAKVYQYVFIIFLTAFIGAWLGSFGDGLLLFIQMELPGGWAFHHWLWIGGAVFAAIGYPLGWIRPNGKKFSFRPWSGWSKIDQNARRKIKTGSIIKPEEDRSPAKVLTSAAMFGIVGAFLGLLLGTSFLLIWFSLAMSPWPPLGWLESLFEESADLTIPHGSHDRRGGLSTRHQVAVYCFFGPSVVLGTLGVFIGGVGAACGWVRDTTEKK